VKTCASAAEALALVSAFRPHVILADVGSPLDEGYAFVRALRALAPSDGGLIPAAALTAAGWPEEARRVLQSGFQLHVVKPLERDRLIAAVAALASGGHPGGPRQAS
jgi:CheY-like chemotaxis protein